MIYLISDKISNTCKIGYSKNPQERLKGLQTSHPNILNIDSIIEGEYKDEKYIHSIYKDYQLQGEWFQYQDGMIEFFNNYKPFGLIKKKPIDNHYSLSDKFNSNYSVKMNKNVLRLPELPLKFYLLLPLIHDNSNKIYFVKSNKESIAKILNITLATIEKCIKMLVENHFLSRVATATYIINDLYENENR